MTQLTLLPASDREILRRCLAVRRAVFVAEKGVPEALEVDDFDRPGAPCAHFLLQAAGVDAGALRCQRPDVRTVRIQRFCLLAPYRGRGLGAAALALVEDHWARQGVTGITLDAKFEVEGFYAACGYQAVSDVFLEAGVPHVRMEKKL